MLFYIQWWAITISVYYPLDSFYQTPYQVRSDPQNSSLVLWGKLGFYTHIYFYTKQTAWASSAEIQQSTNILASLNQTVTKKVTSRTSSKRKLILEEGYKYKVSPNQNCINEKEGLYYFLKASKYLISSALEIISSVTECCLLLTFRNWF